MELEEEEEEEGKGQERTCKGDGGLAVVLEEGREGVGGQRDGIVEGRGRGKIQ